MLKINPKPNIKISQDHDGYSTGLQRLIFFSDAVFAIAITLLAFNIKLPDTLKDSANLNLTKEIINLTPKFAFYALSFLIIGSFWMSHHKMFENIKRYNDAFIFLNIVTLMFIAAIPIPTAIMGDFIMYRQALIFYALYMALTSLLLSSLRFYSIYKNFVEGDALKLYYSVRSLIGPAIFILSIPLLFLSNYVAISWSLVFVFQQVWKKIYFSRIERKKK